MIHHLPYQQRSPLGHWYATTVMSLSLLVLSAACTRERRDFHPPAPPSGSTEIRLSTLIPGHGAKEAPAKHPYEENAYAMSEGKRLFSAFNCVGCHANGGGDIGPPLIDKKWIYGSEPAQIYATVMEGRPNGMPSFRGKIPDTQVWQIVAYVRSMSGQVPQHAAPGRNDHMKSNPPENSVDPEKPKDTGVPPSAKSPQ